MNWLCGYSINAVTGYADPASDRDASSNGSMSTLGLGQGAQLGAITMTASTAYGCQLLRTENSLVAIAGSPRWTVGHLQRLATEQGNAAALSTAYAEYGDECLALLKGLFAAALFDQSRDHVLLAVDKFCSIPLYAVARNDGFAFATSLHLLRTLPTLSLGIDPAAIYQYVYFHCVPGPHTIYRGVRRLEPAQCLLLGTDTWKAKRYWTPSFPNGKQQPFDFGELKRETITALESAIARASDGMLVGAFLSGGIDSSTVVALLSRIRSEAPRTFSIGFADEKYNELYYARIVAKEFHAQHQEYFVTPNDIVSSVPELAAYVEQPFGNSSIVPTFYCARLARSAGVNLLLAGDGGDELFAGNERYATQLQQERYAALLARPIRVSLEKVAALLPNSTSFTMARKLRRLLELTSTPLPDRLQDYNFLSRSGPENVFTKTFLENASNADPLDLLRGEFSRVEAISLLNRMLLLDWKFTLADNDLRKVRYACDLAGIGVSFPFLEDEVVEASIRVPSSMKIKGSQLRWFFKRAVAEFLPDEILTKSKHGFGLPFGVWLLRDRQLSKLAASSLSNLRERNVISSRYLDWLQLQHKETHPAYYGEMIWVLLMLEQWLQRYGADFKIDAT